MESKHYSDIILQDGLHKRVFHKLSTIQGCQYCQLVTGKLKIWSKRILFYKDELEILPRSDFPTILAIKHKLIALSSVIFRLNYCCSGTNVIGRVHVIGDM